MDVNPTRRFSIGLADLGVLLGAASLWWGLWTLFQPLAWIGLGVLVLRVSVRAALLERTQPKEPS